MDHLSVEPAVEAMVGRALVLAERVAKEVASIRWWKSRRA